MMRHCLPRELGPVGALHLRQEFVLSSLARRGNDSSKSKGKAMGLMDYLKTQFLEIIQWEDDSRDTLCYRHPDTQKEIKRGAKLIVRESQVAQFVYLGQ